MMDRAFQLDKQKKDSKQRFIGACEGAALDRPPVWIMRQAGRTLPEYNAGREPHSFWEIVRTPELAALQGNLDPAVLFAPPETIRQRTFEMPS